MACHPCVVLCNHRRTATHLNIDETHQIRASKAGWHKIGPFFRHPTTFHAHDPLILRLLSGEDVRSDL